MTAKIIALEGGDAAGKGTQTTALVQRAQTEGLKATSIAFPNYGDNIAGSICGQLLQGNFGSIGAIHHDLRMLAFASDRFESLPHSTSLITVHDLLVIDRYVV